MHLFHIPLNRRRLLKSLAITSSGFLTQGAFAEALTLTPSQTEGPYFPDKLPLDQDNDLILIKDSLTPAVGEVIQFGGRILDSRGEPVNRAAIEIWQADHHGNYIHSRGALKAEERDAHFQGYGKFETGKDGTYRFRTIKPGLYTGRTRHIHVAVTIPGGKRLVTQLYFKGEPLNERDGVLRNIRDEKQRESVICDFVKASNEPEAKGTWDIVLGWTPEDPA